MLDTIRSARRPQRLAAAVFATGVAAGTFLFLATSASAAPPTVGLGTADSFAVLAGSTITDTGTSAVSGDVGVSPGSVTPGLTAAMVSDGTIHRADAAAASAESDLVTAYNTAADQSSSTAVPVDLAGQVLVAGSYAAPNLALTGTVTLDAQGDPDAVFVLQTAGTLVLASSSRVSLVNGADACHVFWQVGVSATLGTGAQFEGSLLALTSITATTGATIHGRLLARNGAVTLDTNRITRPACAPVTGGGSTAPTTSAPSGEPTTSAPTTASPGTTTGSTPFPTAPGSSTSTSTASPTSTTSPTSAPTAGSVSPSSGPTSGGTTVTVTGTGFAPGDSTVYVDGTALPRSGTHVTSSTSLTFTTPAHAATATSLRVRTAHGTTPRHGLTFTYRTTTDIVHTTHTAATGTPTLTLIGIGAGALALGALLLQIAGMTKRGYRARH